jgi:hypothetical protein
MKSPVVSDGHSHAGGFDGRNGGGRIHLCQCKGLLTENVLTVPRSGNRLCAMERIGRDQDDRIDSGIREDFIVRLTQP